jgi:hypothetical protein
LDVGAFPIYVTIPRTNSHQNHICACSLGIVLCTKAIDAFIHPKKEYTYLAMYFLMSQYFCMLIQHHYFPLHNKVVFSLYSQNLQMVFSSLPLLGFRMQPLLKQVVMHQPQLMQYLWMLPPHMVNQAFQIELS